MQVKWLKWALRNLEQARNYVFQDNPTAAQGLIIKIQNAANQLQKYPFMGKNGRVEGTKELIISNSPYILIYRVKEESVEVLRILHTSKRYPE
ncbi:type II toxin-antitoxin system RelE/ParE family toxin [Dolichospermum planctonicum UHCC 0167]|jgi:addiction module RelE/StbE family toxin|uniref:type II toxin-antitoxin system RelE/ParE family toxin n=1 Tax=Dolichospermum planctonicum TaxID=136072 RepID=UPI0014435949|nr:type II toxin-antitoxin system RelE/ParE family toxin [Dolichospermum planctonicum]MCW9682951.1 type II toxin-antitoxin system RelE/ParE family toxin [Dolichospermum planctonicum UHCC 0167]